MASSNALFQDALLVEDEANLATSIQIAMKKIGIPVRTASTIQAARRAIAEGLPDLLLLDLTLPDGDGLRFCQTLRNEGFDGTVLMLTARGQVEDRVRGLDAGADDYLPKPFAWEELAARIRALNRRRPALAAGPAPHGALPTESQWSLDDHRLRILGPKGWIQLTPLEYKLAHHLITAKGAIVSREALLKNVWGFRFLPKTRTVDYFVGRLRKHFEIDPEKPKYFLTVRGAGYRFASA